MKLRTTTLLRAAQIAAQLLVLVIGPVINFAVGLPGPQALELSTAASIQ
jgi:hypothetical protein